MIGWRDVDRNHFARRPGHVADVGADVAADGGDVDADGADAGRACDAVTISHGEVCCPLSSLAPISPKPMPAPPSPSYHAPAAPTPSYPLLSLTISH